MLQLMLGTNWRTNRDRILDLLAQDVSRKAGGMQKKRDLT